MPARSTIRDIADKCAFIIVDPDTQVFRKLHCIGDNGKPIKGKSEFCYTHAQTFITFWRSGGFTLRSVEREDGTLVLIKM